VAIAFSLCNIGQSRQSRVQASITARSPILAQCPRFPVQGLFGTLLIQ